MLVAPETNCNCAYEREKEKRTARKGKGNFKIYLIGELLQKRSEPGNKGNSGHKFRGGRLAAKQVGVER